MDWSRNLGKARPKTRKNREYGLPLMMPPAYAGNRLEPPRNAGSITIHFAPRITIEGGSSDLKQQIKLALRESSAELVKQVNREMLRRRRLDYS